MQNFFMHSTLIIGCGSIGERHLRCFQKTGRSSVIACDTNPALLAAMRELNSQVYSLAEYFDRRAP